MLVDLLQIFWDPVSKNQEKFWKVYLNDLKPQVNCSLFLLLVQGRQPEKHGVSGCGLWERGYHPFTGQSGRSM